MRHYDPIVKEYFRFKQKGSGSYLVMYRTATKNITWIALVTDMTLIDNYLLLKFHFFQHYYPEAAHVMEGRKYGFNIVSQLLKLFVIFPAVSALAAWICTLF